MFSCSVCRATVMPAVARALAHPGQTCEGTTRALWAISSLCSCSAFAILHRSYNVTNYVVCSDMKDRVVEYAQLLYTQQKKNWFFFCRGAP